CKTRHFPVIDYVVDKTRFGERSAMRGHQDPQASMFSYFSPEARVPAAHPLRSIKAYADTVLKALSRDFDELYATTGRPSIPPERLLKPSFLFALSWGGATGFSGKFSTTTSCSAGFWT